MRHFYIVLCALCTSVLSQAQTNRDDLTPLEISYTTTVSEDLKSFQVGLVVDNVQRPTLHIAMPNWTPGAYGLRNYGERVKGFEARGEWKSGGSSSDCSGDEAPE